MGPQTHTLSALYAFYLFRQLFSLIQDKPWDMTNRERIEVARSMKEIGNKLFSVSFLLK